MIRKLLNKKIDSITMAALMVGVSSLLSRLLGVVRDHILAGRFGAGNDLDVYYAAFRVPDMIFNLVVLGALSAGFIPIFTQLIKSEEEKEKSWELVNNVLNVLSILMIVIVAVLFILAEPLIRLITPGFGPEKLAQTVGLARIMFLSPLLLGLSSVVGGVLQSYKRFLVYSLSPIFYNLGIIIGALFLVPRFGLTGLAWGVSLGSACHLLVQLPVIWNLGWRYQAVLDWKNKQLQLIYKMMTARTLSLVINQVNLLVETIFASTLVSGSLAVFNLANNLQSFPVGIFGLSFAIAAFPAIAASAFDKDRLVYYFSKTLRQIFYFIIPSTVVLILLRAQIVRLVLGSGKFDWNDTILTMNTLTFFALSLFAQATIPLLVRFYYARHDSRTPLYLGLIASAVNIVLNYYLVHSSLGVAALALSFSLSSIVQFALLFIFLRIELGSLDEGLLFKSIGKMLLAASAAGLVIQLMKTWLGFSLEISFGWQLLLQFVLPASTGLAVYGIVTYWLKSPEILNLLKHVQGRLPWRQVGASDQGEARGI